MSVAETRWHEICSELLGYGITSATIDIKADGNAILVVKIFKAISVREITMEVGASVPPEKAVKMLVRKVLREVMS